MRRRQQQPSPVFGMLVGGAMFLMFWGSCSMIASLGKSGGGSSTYDADEWRRSQARESQQAWEDRQADYLLDLRTEMDRRDKRF